MLKILNAKLNILNGNRFDLFAKYIYIKYSDLNLKGDWYRELYNNHILTFNGAWEYPGDKKTELKHFTDSFDNLISSVKKEGIKEGKETNVEINQSNVLINNAHRFITTFYYNKQIPLSVQPKYNAIQGYSYDFFKNRLKYGTEGIPEFASKRIPKGMDEVWMDTMALEATKLKPNTRVITIFPVADVKYDNKIEKQLKKEGTIVYKKEVNLTQNGLYNYIKELYLGETWIGYTRNDKTRDTWGKFPVRVYIYTPEEKTDMVDLKAKLRNQYGTKDSVHINDTHEEAIRYAKSILFSSYYLNHGKELSPNNKKMFEEYKTIMKDKNSDFVCIDSSFVLAFYGLREAKDLDFLHFKYKKGDFLKSPLVHSHNTEEKYYVETIEDIIFDPRNHFYVNGYKVANIDVVKDMKMVRGEEKDKKDVKLIEIIH